MLICGSSINCGVVRVGGLDVGVVVQHCLEHFPVSIIASSDDELHLG